MPNYFLSYLLVENDPYLKDQSKPFDSKKNCWIPDAEDGYIAAEITSTKGDNVTVVSARGNEVCLNDKYKMTKFDEVWVLLSSMATI